MSIEHGEEAIYVQDGDGAWHSVGILNDGHFEIASPVTLHAGMTIDDVILAVFAVPGWVSSLPPRPSTSEVLGEIDDALTDWEDRGDAAHWAADGSHEHDPPSWTQSGYYSDAPDVSVGLFQVRSATAAALQEGAERFARFATLMRRAFPPEGADD